MIRALHTGLPCRYFLSALGALVLLAAVQNTFADSAAEGSSNVAKNLARMNCGTQIECTTPDGRMEEVATANEGNRSAAALIMDDDTLSCPLQEGETTFVIKLAATALLDRFTFVNENANAAGKLKISVSNYHLPVASDRWVEVDGTVNFSNKRLFNLSMMGVEARYVKLSFNVEKGGRIASLGLYGAETLESFAARHERTEQQFAWISNIIGAPGHSLEDKVNFNFANLYAKAHVVHVSSGPIPGARRMIDDDSQTGFQFAASDPHPTVIVELADSERLQRVSALYTMKAPGRLDVYLLDELSKSSIDLAYQTPVASVTDENGAGKAAVNFDPQGARYVALRWTPASDAAGQRGFEIAEIDAFGEVSLAMLQLNEAPDLYASSAGMQFPGQSSPDLSNTLGTIAIPPTLPVVSP